MVYRLNCTREKADSMKKLDDRRDASVITEKESCGKDSQLSATEDTTEVQAANTGTDSCLACR